MSKEPTPPLVDFLNVKLLQIILVKTYSVNFFASKKSDLAPLISPIFTLSVALLKYALGSSGFTAIASVKYPPKGFRGVGLARAQKYGVAFEEYKKWNEHDSRFVF